MFGFPHRVAATKVVTWGLPQQCGQKLQNLVCRQRYRNVANQSDYGCLASRGAREVGQSKNLDRDSFDAPMAAKR